MLPVSASAFMVDYEQYCPQLHSNFGKGDSDSSTDGQVSRLQRFLNTRLTVPTPMNKALEPLKMTGFFGPKTERYLRQFQKQYGLQGLGMVGPKTRSKIATLVCGATIVRPEREVPRENLGKGDILFGEGIVVDPAVEHIPKLVQQYAFDPAGKQRSDVIRLGYVNQDALLRLYAARKQRNAEGQDFVFGRFPELKVYVTCGWQQQLKSAGTLTSVPDSFGNRCNPFSIGATDGRVDVPIDAGAFN
ncbi:MAG: putative peptidoglycan binding domain [Candidatus Parcubacteria bacterium]